MGGVDSGAEIFLESVPQKDMKSMKQGFLIDDMYPGKYLVSVKKDGFTSWSKDIVVRGEKVTEVYPLIVPLDIVRNEISRQVESQRGFFRSATPTSMITNDLFVGVLGLFSEDDDSGIIARRAVTVWKNGREVKYRWVGGSSSGIPYFCGNQNCVATSTAYTALEPIGRIDFYPGRNDVVLLGLASGIYALEIDNRLPQHLVQIYSGTNVDFRVEDNETMYVRDGQRLFQVEI